MKTQTEFVKTLDFGNFDFADDNITALTAEHSGLASHPYCDIFCKQAARVTSDNRAYVNEIYKYADLFAK